ncbi:hypothetical protein SGRA_0956 [Saprospira grandis str. Lewin]|uniref:Uncharacterized protein n=1 Tax=Saprospira grandis (strain Lewin) TaxID=984262 RepID=H6L2W5_SAPGL|nr:hypothetical protein SGRA_0956 [Saprospira grandis str. Lewin]
MILLEAEEEGQKVKKRDERPSAAQRWPQARPSGRSPRRAEQTCEPRSIAAASFAGRGPQKKRRAQKNGLFY